MKILSNRLTAWAEENAVLDESQAGFRRGYATTDNIFNLHAIVQKYISKRRGRIYVFYVDFLKAFDNCVHTKLWESLSRKGIDDNGKFMIVFKTMYSKLKSCIKLSSGDKVTLTDYFNCCVGTKQGCVTSTIIFDLFIDDLMSYIKSKSRNGIFISEEIGELYGLMFADDVSSFADTVVNLQQQINLIGDFCIEFNSIAFI